MKRQYLLALAAALIAAPASYAQFAATGTTTLSVTVGAEAALSVTTSNTTLAAIGTIFNPYTGTTNLIYKIRTTQVDWNRKRDAESHLRLQSGQRTFGHDTADRGRCFDLHLHRGRAWHRLQRLNNRQHELPLPALRPSAPEPVPPIAGNAASTAWSLTNDPVYHTGAYSATVTYTIAAI